MKLLLVITLATLSVAACNEPQTSTHYVCNQQIATVTTINAHSAWLTFNNKRYKLSHEQNASGDKYINDHVLFWGKANEATLIINGTRYRCQTQ
ncbi:MliC family protein [Pseudoalteromonas sp.]|uniref:MliC family protein n=1 Tax=Pseudoalteromonas sp. TaxID=53249 RepID=UPI00356903E2